MALKKGHRRRKRIFSQMSCSASPIITQFNGSSSFYSMTAKTKNGKMKAHGARYFGDVSKHNFNFNKVPPKDPRPRKRRKISHHKPIAIVPRSRTPPKLHNLPILHHCVINERYNMLKNQRKNHKKFALPILTILDQTKPKKYHYQSDVNDYFEDNQSTDSYQSAYSHFDDDSVPSMDINDGYDNKNIATNDNFCPFQPSIDHYHQSITSYPHNVQNDKKQNIKNDEFRWNDYSRFEKRQFVNYKERVIQYRTCKNVQNTSIKCKILRLCPYLIIIALIAWNLGIFDDERFDSGEDKVRIVYFLGILVGAYVVFRYLFVEKSKKTKRMTFTFTKTHFNENRTHLHYTQ